MAITIRPIREKENDDVYQMFQDIPEEEFEATNHAHGITRPEFDAFCKKMNDFSVENAKGMKELPGGKVPQTLYIIFDDNVPVGFGKFRPFLNEACIKNRAGHFAYMISPNFRGKGYATQFVSFVKQEAEKLGLTEIEGTALKRNLASCRVMEKNGGEAKKCIDEDIIYKIALQRNKPR